MNEIKREKYKKIGERGVPKKSLQKGASAKWTFSPLL